MGTPIDRNRAIYVPGSNLDMTLQIKDIQIGWEFLD
jgi:hypothetical protein